MMSEMRVEKIGLIDKLRSKWMTFLKIIITRTNMWVLIKSNGRLGNSFLGKSVLLLHSIGSKSGIERITPLFYLADGDRVILVASNAGTLTNPAWFNNLKADPQVKINIKGTETNMLAHQADSEEFDQLWPAVIEMFPTWERIQEKSVRNFPLMVLEPR